MTRCGKLKSAKVIENGDCLTKCHSQEEPKETGQLNAVWGTGWDPEIEESHESKRKET